MFFINNFSFFVGLTSWFIISFRSQRILNKNLFEKFSKIAIVISLVCFFKDFFFGFNILGFLFGLLPILYLIHFRVLTHLFFPSYPDQKPTIIFSSKYGQTYFQGKVGGYKPSWKEKFYSFFLILGFYGLVGIFIAGISIF